MALSEFRPQRVKCKGDVCDSRTPLEPPRENEECDNIDGDIQCDSLHDISVLVGPLNTEWCVQQRTLAPIILSPYPPADSCDEPEEDCSEGYPSVCNSGCAAVLLPLRYQRMGICFALDSSSVLTEALRLAQRRLPTTFQLR